MLIDKSIHNSGTNTGAIVSGDNNNISLCEKDLELANSKIEYLEALLIEKDGRLKDKDDIIEMLRMQIKNK
ncbi:hypothetical protein FACS189452_03700 [Bacteroidia bacterium]|nr:hypothetical protein FACS189452_03700 [Bacteroidia bacterium]